MDKIKGMAEKAMNKGGSSGNTGASNTGGASGKEDYGDKGRFLFPLSMPVQLH